MAFKNYYKVLGVAPSATLPVIKKRFRQLALQYHPDTHDANDYTKAYYADIQEAYEVLSNTSKRTLYHYEWKAQFPGLQIDLVVQHNPDAVLYETRMLNKEVAAADMFRSDKLAIQQQILHILSGDNMQMLLHYKDNAVNFQIVRYLISVVAHLPHELVLPVVPLLKQLADNNDRIIKEIEELQLKNKKKSVWEKYYPVLAVAIALAICVFIFMLSH